MNFRYLKYLLVVFIVAGFTSCSLFRDDDTTETDKFYVSHELVATYLKDQVKLFLGQYATVYPEINSIKDKVETGVMVYKMNYYTVFNNELKTASGLVCVPITDGSYPLFSFHNGTNTLNSQAPSMNPNSQVFMLLEFVATTGFVVVIPDYLGFGKSSDMFHPYLHKESTVKSVIDMNRAAKELIMNHFAKERSISVNGDIYLNGYSQGGWTTMQVQREMETKFSSEFKVKASSCGAGPYDLNFVNDYIIGLTTYPNPYYVGYLFNSFIKTGGITLKPADILNEPYATKIGTMYTGNQSPSQLNEQLTTKISELFNADYLKNNKTDSKYAPIITAMTNNSVAVWKTNVPTRLYHGTADTSVPVGVSEKTYNDFIKAGVATDKIKYITYPGLDHGTALIPTELATVNWFLELKAAN